MKIFVPELEKKKGEFLPFLYRVSLASLGVHLPGCSQSPLTVSLHASYLGGRVLVKGQWQINLIGECSRCLEQTPYSLSEQFTEEFISGGSGVQEAGWGLYRDEEEVLVYRGEILDLKEYLRQSFLVAQPLKILCHDDCRGLCPECGVNRNQGECRCQNEALDPRLGVLVALKNKLKE